MRRFDQSRGVYRGRGLRGGTRYEHYAAMRAAKARKRLDNPPAEPEPKMLRYYPFEFACRHKATGEVAWHDLISVRHAARALGLVLKAFECPTP